MWRPSGGTTWLTSVARSSGDVLRLEGAEPARAEPAVAALVELARDRAELAHDDRLLLSPLGVQRALEQLEGRRGIARSRSSGCDVGWSIAMTVLAASSWAPSREYAVASS